jgi:hypothetical protein
LNHLNWSPGIGDPTIGGWVIVVLYFLASISCWVTARNLHHGQERLIWRSFSVLFLLLGINKQLDLLSALTELGRHLAKTQGWYAQHRSVQLAFIFYIAVLCVIAVATLLIWARRSPASTWFVLLGTIVVFGFMLIRATSFHSLDRFIFSEILGYRWKWILEMGGISIVLIASHLRRRSL